MINYYNEDKAKQNSETLHDLYRIVAFDVNNAKTVSICQDAIMRVSGNPTDT